MTPSQAPQVLVSARRHTAYYNSSFTFLHSSSDNYEVLAELTSVADAVWMWATHEATLDEWDLARGMFPGKFVA